MCWFHPLSPWERAGVRVQQSEQGRLRLGDSPSPRPSPRGRGGVVRNRSRGRCSWVPPRSAARQHHRQNRTIWPGVATVSVDADRVGRSCSSPPWFLLVRFNPPGARLSRAPGPATPRYQSRSALDPRPARAASTPDRSDSRIGRGTKPWAGTPAHRRPPLPAASCTAGHRENATSITVRALISSTHSVCRRIDPPSPTRRCTVAPSLSWTASGLGTAHQVVLGTAVTFGRRRPSSPRSRSSRRGSSFRRRPADHQGSSLRSRSIAAGSR